MVGTTGREGPWTRILADHLWPGIQASRELAAAKEQRSGRKAVARASGVCFGSGGAGAVRPPRTTPQSSRVCIWSACAGERTGRSETVVYERLASVHPRV